MTSSYHTTTSHVRSSNKCPQQQSVNDDQLDLNTLSPTNLRLENNEMESMLADLSPSSFSSIDDETTWFWCQYNLSEASSIQCAKRCSAV